MNYFLLQFDDIINARLKAISKVNYQKSTNTKSKKICDGIAIIGYLCLIIKWIKLNLKI